MNFPPGLYEAYPDGSKDNTHFQPAGAVAVAELVFSAMKRAEASPAAGTPAMYYRDIEFSMPLVV